MTLWQAILLGTVQGLGEFLPISSSAHLIIFPWMFHFPDPGLTFDVALHLGTLISLLAYFYRDWLKLIAAFFRSLRKSPKKYDFEEKLIWLLILGSIPAAAAGFAIEHYAETVLRDPRIIAAMMAVFGILLYVSDRVAKKYRNLEEVNLKDSIVIGLWQCLALIPGSSRSGVTITGGLGRGFTRESAARFSFLLSTPIVAGAALLKLPKFFSQHVDAVSITGIVVSAVVGYFSIKYMLHFLKKYSFSVYIVYRLAFAAVVLTVFWLR